MMDDYARGQRDAESRLWSLFGYLASVEISEYIGIGFVLGFIVGAWLL